MNSGRWSKALKRSHFFWSSKHYSSYWEVKQDLSCSKQNEEAPSLWHSGTWSEGWARSSPSDTSNVTYSTTHFLLSHRIRHGSISTQVLDIEGYGEFNSLACTLWLKELLLSCSMKLIQTSDSSCHNLCWSALSLSASAPPEEKQQAGQGEKQQEFRKRIKAKGNTNTGEQIICSSFYQHSSSPQSLTYPQHSLGKSGKKTLDFWLHWEVSFVLTGHSAT